jgi:hypothetical protein
MNKVASTTALVQPLAPFPKAFLMGSGPFISATCRGQIEEVSLSNPGGRVGRKIELTPILTIRSSCAAYHI